MKGFVKLEESQMAGLNPIFKFSYKCRILIASNSYRLFGRIIDSSPY
jgi:hypothetical protein